ncbi:MAG: hypothetical protein M1549_03990 [Candidatus Dependentiae bacterium]|nr:hypothetical protein [Candidatus Dependentiae bacterium]
MRSPLLTCTLLVLTVSPAASGATRVLGESKPSGTTGQQTRTQHWQAVANGSLSNFFNQTLPKADVAAARKLINCYATATCPDETSQRTAAQGTSITDPLKMFLETTRQSYAGFMSVPLQGIFYARAAEKDRARQARLDEIADLFLKKTDPTFLINRNSGTLQQRLPGRTDEPIPYLHFALGHGMQAIAQKLLEKVPGLAQQRTDTRRSVLSYAFKGGITDPTLIAKLVNNGAILTEGDVKFFVDPGEQMAFAVWIQDQRIPTQNLAGYRGFFENSERLVAEQALKKLALSLQELVGK